ncbi:MAG TPA: bifunctional diaminohydroxyphosphoribosylaminopyrimidine deaminase/5-amino-6-(5-phosphoribosylamino)uracil reductase RibD [Planctomycetes bacterium]|nr:bifunctional diaminohydroxyphosphoribosylaminopyrimidine deaminase/5-amino-6-(5-phosphoribosylamino)uracil reductase RibD [Planctomycetota bacterium]
MSDKNESYMQTALKLAQRGIGSVEPNPAVGAVLVKANQVIGKGWHREFGGPHAEINALENCKTLGVNPRGATMYVSLEPCCHQAKTGPCTEAIIAAGLVKVVVATIDPSEHANGKGIEQLRNAGVEVVVGVCETQARLLNAPFFKFTATGKTWVILKWAQSIDSKVAYTDKSRERRWISGEQSRKDVHKLRRRAGAILVGINTVIADDPLLTARPVRSPHRKSTGALQGLTSNGARPSKGKKATRIVLDSHLRIPLDCKLLATTKEAPVLILTSQQTLRAHSQIVEKVNQKGAEVLAYPDAPARSNLYFLTSELAKRGIAQLLVEGGPTVIASFLKQRLADEIVVYITPKILGAQGGVGINPPMAELTEAVDLYNVDIKRFGDDVRLTGLSKKALDEISICP